MQIVIDIPEHYFEELKCVELNESNEGVVFHAIKCILNGTPLPKGHGRLIDAGALLMDFAFAYNKSAGECVHDAPTIIDADKENE